MSLKKKIASVYCLCLDSIIDRDRGYIRCSCVLSLCSSAQIRAAGHTQPHGVRTETVFNICLVLIVYRQFPFFLESSRTGLCPRHRFLGPQWTIYQFPPKFQEQTLVTSSLLRRHQASRLCRFWKTKWFGEEYISSKLLLQISVLAWMVQVRLHRVLGVR